MMPQTLIQDATRDGLTMAPTDKGTLRVHGPKAALAKWAPILKERKAEILEALSPSQTVTVAVPWMDADSVTVTELPPEDEATIRAWLASLGETAAAIEQDIETARRFPDTAAWLLARAHIDVGARAMLHTCGECQHFTHDPEGGGGIGTCAITKAGHPPKDASGYPLCYPCAQRRCPNFEAAKGKLA